MAYTTIDDPSAHFHVQLYTGTGSTQSVGNDGNSDLKPDWVWIKKRNSSGNNGLFDSSRGATKELVSNGGNAESTDAQLLTQFDTDGFTVGTNSGVNGSSDTFVAFQWKANGGTTSSNSDGNSTTTVQANTTAGFSIVLGSFTGSTQTYGHGLGVTPNIVLWKNRSNTNSWLLLTNAIDGTQDYGILNGTNAFSAITYGFSSTTFEGNDDASTNFVAYCFAEKQGFSKFGKYKGNGNSDGAFVYTGFKPRWIMVKRTDDSGYHWRIYDTKRSSSDGSNPLDERVNANLDEAEGTHASDFDIDALSNGFKFRTSSQINVSNGIYFYMAFAENPFVTSDDGGSIPTTAR